MARAPAFCGVILAAGDSSRMGRDKALLPWQGGTFLSAGIDLLRPHSDLVIVVAGKNAEALGRVADAQAAYLVRNPRPELGQFSSLQVGLHEVLNRGRDAAIVALIDRPPARSETVRLLHDAFLAALGRGKWAAVPEYQGQHGHPIIAGREMMEAFLKAAPDSTAREVEHSFQQHIEYVAVDDPRVTMNLDTPEDYQRIVGEEL